MNALNSSLLSFLIHLKSSKIFYSLDHVRDDAIMVHVIVPGERWEVEFFDNGEVEIEIFKSDGAIFGKEALTKLFQKYTD